jgi:hypothetical protein
LPDVIAASVATTMIAAQMIMRFMLPSATRADPGHARCSHRRAGGPSTCS